MTTAMIKPGTAARMGLRKPLPRGLLVFPRAMSQEQVARFKAALARGEAHPRGNRYVYWPADEGIDVHSIDVEEQRVPQRARWEVAVYLGVGVAVVALVWLTLVLIYGSSAALTPPAALGLVGALVSGVGVFGPLLSRRRRSR